MITMKADIVLHQLPLGQWLQDLPHPSHRLRRWKCPGEIPNTSSRRLIIGAIFTFQIWGASIRRGIFLEFYGISLV